MGELVLTMVRASMVLFALWILGTLVSEAEVAPGCTDGTSVKGAAVRVTVKPDTVYVERSETGQHRNHDFLLENLTDDLLLTASSSPCSATAGALRGAMSSTGLAGQVPGSGASKASSYFGGFRRVGSQTLVGRGRFDIGDVVENR